MTSPHLFPQFLQRKQLFSFKVESDKMFHVKLSHLSDFCSVKWNTLCSVTYHLLLKSSLIRCRGSCGSQHTSSRGISSHPSARDSQALIQGKDWKSLKVKLRLCSLARCEWGSLYSSELNYSCYVCLNFVSSRISRWRFCMHQHLNLEESAFIITDCVHLGELHLAVQNIAVLITFILVAFTSTEGTHTHKCESYLKLLIKH